MPGLELRMGQRLEQRLQLRLQQVFGPGDLVEPFRTDAEHVQVSQYALIDGLIDLIDQGEFFDPTHFGLEINRTVFGHPLEAQLGHFGRDLMELVEFYRSDDGMAKRVLSAITAQKAEEKKDIPAQVSAGWNRVVKSPYAVRECSGKALLAFIEQLKAHDADIASGIDVLATVASLKGQHELFGVSQETLRIYATDDPRRIPFAQLTLPPILRAVGQHGAHLDTLEAEAVYSRIVGPLCMLDRDLRVSGIAEKIAKRIRDQGVSALLTAPLPIPIHAVLDAVSPDAETVQVVVRLCDDVDFAKGRERQRQIYRGLAALEEMEDGSQVLAHLVRNVTDARGLARVVSAISLVSAEPDFHYPFQLEGEDALLRNLRLQLVDKSIKRLALDDATLERYLQRLETDERFARFGKIVTTLVGYPHYQNDEQTALLRQIAQVALDGKFRDWRYMHAAAEAQLQVLGGQTTEWRKNTSVTRIVGELDALNAHIQAVKALLPKLKELYSEHYQQGKEPDTASFLAATIKANEQRLHDGLGKREQDQLGYQTALLREQLAYVRLFDGLAELSEANYPQVLQQAEELARKKSKNPLYEGAKWVRETLDQPVYRDARKITVVETDDLETLLRFGETPVPHCQNWKANSSYNKCLLSFVADADKKLYLITNGGGHPISMTMVRLQDWKGVPTILAENVYANEWSDDYGVALVGSLADKALSIHEETGKNVHLATNDEWLLRAMQKFAEKYNVEMCGGEVKLTPPRSMNTYEYWDCGPGTQRSGQPVSFHVQYITFGTEE